MSKLIQWNGPSFKIREIYGYTFTSGQIHQVDDDEQALDMLTQPGDFFVEASEEEHLQEEKE